MKKKTLIKLAGIILLCIGVVFAIVFYHDTPSDATEDTFSLKTGKNTVKKEETFTVQLNVKNLEKLQAAQAAITYDPSFAEYVSSDSDKITGDSGTLTLKDTYTNGITQKNYTLKFKALKPGTCKFSLQDTVITLYDTLEDIKKGSSSKEIKIIANPSKNDDATLEELVIGSGELTPEWNPDTTSYTVQVPKDTKIFTYSATAKLKNATVVSDGPKTLHDGNNIYTITVTAPSGDTGTYTITVKR